MPLWLSLVGRTFDSHTVDQGSSPGGDRPKSLKEVVTVPLPTLGIYIIVFANVMSSSNRSKRKLTLTDFLKTIVRLIKNVL